MKYKLEARLQGEISITSGMQMRPPLMAETEEELKSLLMKVKSKSEVSRVQPSATPCTAALQGPPSMEFSRQEYWNGVPLPSLDVFCI